MTPRHPLTGFAGIRREPARARLRPLSLFAITLLAASSAGAAEKTFQYYRFATAKVQNNNSQMQISEFTLSHNGSILNTNNRNGTGTVIPITVTAGGQDVNAGEGALKVFDGSLDTKWFNNNALTVALDIAFTAPTTVDSYNFATANDSVEFNRTPVSWRLFGSTDNVNWELLDARTDFAITNTNKTYQPGFTIPADMNPFISRFGFSGPAVVTNSQSLTLDWQTSNADAGGVSIAPVPGVVAQTGTHAFVQADNTTTTYTITASKATPPATATATVTGRTVAGGSSNYRYVRFTPVDFKGDEFIQLAEFELYNGVTKLTGITATNPGGDTPGAEGIDKLVDGITTGNNKWLDRNRQPVIFDIGDDGVFDRYQFFTGNDATVRDPIRWLMEGSDDQVTWNLLDNIDFEYPTTDNRNASSQMVPLPGASLVPIIESFTSNGTVKVQGEPVILSWNTHGAGSYTISPTVGTVAADGTFSLGTPPVGTTTYTFTVTSPNGQVTASETLDLTIVAPPTVTEINYGDFSSAGDEISYLGSADISGSSLRVTPELQSQRGEAWFRTPQPVANGFEATFGLAMNQTQGEGVGVPADGMAFVIQNHADGAYATSTGEGGVTSNALNISFTSFGFDNDASEANASRLRILDGENEIYSTVLQNTIGVELKGTTSNPGITTAINAGEAPHRVRVVYFDGALDVYFNGICVAQNIPVDLEDISAVDGTGKAYVGFTARTGGNVQSNDITDWKMRFGDFTALPPFGLVKSIFKFTNEAGVADKIQLVWDSDPEKNYSVTTSTSLAPASWTPLMSFPGDSGQVGVELDIPEGSAGFFRIEEEP